MYLCMVNSWKGTHTHIHLHTRIRFFCTTTDQKRKERRTGTTNTTHLLPHEDALLLPRALSSFAAAAFLMYLYVVDSRKGTRTLIRLHTRIHHLLHHRPYKDGEENGHYEHDTILPHEDPLLLPRALSSFAAGVFQMYPNMVNCLKG